MRSSLTTVLTAALALTLAGAVPAAAHDTRGSEWHRPGLPTTYLLDPVGPAADDIYPEGIAARGNEFYVSSTTDGTIYRGELDEPTPTPEPEEELEEIPENEPSAESRRMKLGILNATTKASMAALAPKTWA